MALIKLNNQSLTAVTSAGLPSGTVLQVVNTTHNAQVNIQGTTAVEYTGISTSITPKATGSHILCTVKLYAGNNYGGGIWYQSGLYRDTTSNLIGNLNDFYYNSQYEQIGPRFLNNIIDTSGTTAGTARTYRLYLSALSNASGYLRVNWATGNRNESSMTLMEIAG